MPRLHHPRPLRTLAVLTVAAATAVPLLAGAPSAGAVAGAADQTAAQAGVVVASDLGTGWTETPRKPSDDSDSDLRKYASCRRLGKAVTLLSNKAKKYAEAKSSNFEQAGIKVSNQTIVLANDQTATMVMNSLASPTFANCLRDVGNRAAAKVKKDPKLAGQVASTSVSVTPTSLSLPGDQEAALLTVMTLRTKAGVAIQAGFVFDFVRVGRALDGISVQYSPSATQRLPSAVLGPSVQRLQTALAAAPPAG
jgi:hypothetical protein